MVMFILAAAIEGFISPSAAPYWVKASVAVFSAATLVWYFVILGYPRNAYADNDYASEGLADRGQHETQ